MSPYSWSWEVTRYWRERVGRARAASARGSASCSPQNKINNHTSTEVKRADRQMIIIKKFRQSVGGRGSSFYMIGSSIQFELNIITWQESECCRNGPQFWTAACARSTAGSPPSGWQGQGRWPRRLLHLQQRLLECWRWLEWMVWGGEWSPAPKINLC